MTLNRAFTAIQFGKEEKLAHLLSDLGVHIDDKAAGQTMSHLIKTLRRRARWGLFLVKTQESTFIKGPSAKVKDQFEDVAVFQDWSQTQPWKQWLDNSPTV